MNHDELFRRYQELQRYVAWSDDDARRIAAAAAMLEPHLPALVDDFYEEIDRHDETRKVITGGAEQVQRLKGTLTGWLRELLSGCYDAAYVARRWQVGWRHVEIGLDQVYAYAALARLRLGLMSALERAWTGPPEGRSATALALHKLLDLDLAIIELAYQCEYISRQQRSERLAAIGQVSAGVAHELRNPLNVVKTSVYYLLNARSPSPEKTTEHLQRISRHVDLADGVITALSRFARMPSPELRPCPVERCLREALDVNPPGEAIQVSLDCPAEVPPVLVDPEQIRIVFGNLIRNAREAMPQGGQLALTACCVDGAVEVAFTDTGQGIAPENLARILEPLYSTKARGLGLGLSIARAILEKHGGSLRVRSALGHGSTFTVRLTAATLDPAAGPA
jgi:signal transduction histidine kinase